MSKPQNPFPGLRPFEAADADRFFGRDDQINALMRRLRRHRFVALLGGSGSGKSSLVRAGLIPRLLRGMKVRDQDNWRIAICRPGMSPLHQLALALAPLLAADSNDAETGKDTEQQTEAETASKDCSDDRQAEADLQEADDKRAMQVAMLEATLHRGSHGLLEATRTLTDNLLIVVDQFEELFRLQRDEHERDDGAELVRMLLAATEQKRQPIHILITMRSDFLADCSGFHGLTEAINDGLYMVPRLDREHRRAVIEGPLDLAGLNIAPRLVQRLLNDVGDNPDQLPILQHALMRTCDAYLADVSQQQRPMDLPDYEAIGTMAHALDQQGDELYKSLSDTEQARLSTLFKRLTMADANGRARRSPARLLTCSQAIDCTTADLIPLIDRFRNNSVGFLTPAADVELDEDSLIDISHESLIRVWSRAQEWVAEEKEKADTYFRLLQRSQQYAAGKDTWLAQPALGLFMSWQEQSRPSIAWAKRYGGDADAALTFLQDSHEQEQREVMERRAARQKALEQAQALADERQDRLAERESSVARLQILAFASVIAAVLAVVAALWGFNKHWEAEESKKRELTAYKIQSIHQDLDSNASPKNELKKATELYALNKTADTHAVLNRALQSTLAHEVIAGSPLPETRYLYANKGLIKILSLDQRIHTWSANGNNVTRKSLEVDFGSIIKEHFKAELKKIQEKHKLKSERDRKEIEMYNSTPAQLVIDDEGQRYALAMNQTLHIGYLHPGQDASKQAGNDIELGTTVTSLAWTGNHLICGTEDYRLLGWTVDKGSVEESLNCELKDEVPEGTILHKFSALHIFNNYLLCGTEDGDITIRSITDGTLIKGKDDGKKVAKHKGMVSSISARKRKDDSTIILSTGQDDRLCIWHLSKDRGDEAPKLKGVLKLDAGHGAITDAVLSNKGHQAITVGWDRYIRQWDLHSGRMLRELSTEFTTVTPNKGLHADGQGHLDIRLAIDRYSGDLIVNTVEGVLHRWRLGLNDLKPDDNAGGFELGFTMNRTDEQNTYGRIDHNKGQITIFNYQDQTKKILHTFDHVGPWTLKSLLRHYPAAGCRFLPGGDIFEIRFGNELYKYYINGADLLEAARSSQAPGKGRTK